MNPLVSVIIPTCNSSSTIKRCLESLKEQTYSRREIILVDRKSNDNTRKIARLFTRKIFTGGPERSAQINIGIRKAKGKYIYRVDSDFIVEPRVIEECVDLCELNHVDGVAVHNTSADGLGFWSDVRKLERDTYVDDRLIVAVRFFSKKSWKNVGGLDESLYGPEDYDFHNRFIQGGFKWGRIKSKERHLGEPKTLMDIYKKHFWYGKQMLFYFRKHPSVSILQFNPIRLSYFRHVKILLDKPTLTLGLIIMTITKFFAGGMGFLIAITTNYRPQIYSQSNGTKTT